MTTLKIELTEAEAQRVAILAARDAQETSESLRRLAANGAPREQILDMARVSVAKDELRNKLADFAFGFPVVDQPGK